MPIIKTENLHFTYDGDELETLHGVSLEIEEGSFVAILGHNGSGKSTLAKLFNGILLPTEGRVLVDGVDTSHEERLLDVRRTVGLVFQNPDNQIVANVVEDDVAFAPENLGVEPEEIRRRVDDALRTVVGMYEYRLHAPHLLSGGAEAARGDSRRAGHAPEVHRPGRADGHAGPHRPPGGHLHRLRAVPRAGHNRRAHNAPHVGVRRRRQADSHERGADRPPTGRRARSFRRWELFKARGAERPPPRRSLYTGWTRPAGTCR